MKESEKQHDNKDSVIITKLTDDHIIAKHFLHALQERKNQVSATKYRITQNKVSIEDFASAHEYFGLHKIPNGWVIREWAPHATEIILYGDFSDWKPSLKYQMNKIDVVGGIWELQLAEDDLRHGQLYKLLVKWNEGEGERIPSYARRVVQDDITKLFSAQVWNPPKQYEWKNSTFKPPFSHPIIYEAHIGMGQEKDGIGNYEEFRINILPRIKKANYNTLQIMAVMEHPYYGSFGYHVSNFFAASSRFGTPEEFKHLIDDAHGMGLAVIMDLVHSHSVKNEREGLSRFDGTYYQYFHDGERGEHRAWDSKCFNYGKTEVLHFLLSNCRFWLDEYKMDGYRFDGVTSMLYYDHGLGINFGHYDNYFGADVDMDSLIYLTLANEVIHKVKPDAITIAEDVSGMPGLGALISDGGVGFDYRLALGIPDFWFGYFKKVRDEHWDVDHMFFELTNRRGDEKTISYVECHDQAIVGSKTMAFWLMDAEMYAHMNKSDDNMVISRGVALHKMIRMITIATATGGYLNFMGNEFGHPEWVDFPREGNNWSYKYAKRQWSLVDNPLLKYECLSNCEKDFLKIIEENNSMDKIPKVNYSRNFDKVISFIRGPLVFIFNFHPDKSVFGYFIDIEFGEYKLIFDTDKKEYGGQERIEQNQIFKTTSTQHRNGISVYLPCRTAIVLKRG